jgi:predicted FMN-binding regulatory protein PaiB
VKSLRSLAVLAFMLLVATALVPACKKAPEIMTPSAIENTLSAVKDQYVREVTGLIDDYHLKADELAKKAEAMPAPAREEAMKRIDILKAKLAEGRAKLDQVKTATDASWDKTKTDMDTVIKDLATLYSEAVSAVK